MKLTWWDAEHSKITCELEDGETFMGVAGAASFQITGPDLQAIEEMDPKPEIEEAPVPGGEAEAEAVKAPAKAPAKPVEPPPAAHPQAPPPKH